MQIEIDTDRLKAITALGEGAHEEGSDTMCVMEAVAFVAREPWSDQPQCACPVIGAFLRSWNDSLPDAERNELFIPLIPRLVGTRGSKALEERRSLMAADWLVRTHTPAWLRLAGLTTQAEALSSLPEITNMDQVPSIRPAIDAVRADADAAGGAAKAAAKAATWDAAWDAARDAAGDAAGAAACDAAGDAAWAATRDAAWDATWAAVWDAARDAAGTAAWVAAKDAARAAAGGDVWGPVWDAAKDAARAAARGALEDTKKDLQKSALALVERMIEARD